MKKIMIVLIVGVLLLNLLNILYTYKDDLLESDSHQIISLNSGVNDIDISFEYEFYGFDNKIEKEILFSSSDNRYICYIEKTGQEGRFSIFYPNKEGRELFGVLVPNIKHKVEITHTDNTIQLFIDNIQVGENNFDKNDTSKLEYIQITDDNEYKFNGRINNFIVRSVRDTNNINALNKCVLMLNTIFIIVYVIYNIYLLAPNSYKNTSKEKKFLNVIAFCLMMVALIRGSQNYIPWEKYYFISAYVISILLAWVLWTRSGLKKMYGVGIVVAIIVVIKGFYIHMSFWGAISDLFIGMFTLGCIQNLIKIIENRISGKRQIMASVISFFIASGIFLLTLGAMYIHYIQKVAEPTTLFGEEAQAIFQSNINEMYEFVMSVFSIEQIFIAVIVSVISAVCLYKLFSVKSSEKLVKSNYVHMGLLGVIALISTYIAGIGQSLAAPVMELANAYHNSVIQMEEYQKLRKENSNLTATKIGKGETYVVVLGESGNRRHYGAYSYFRNTTPWMSDLREDGHTIFMENAYASFVHTVPSMLNMLTSASQYNDQVNFAAPSIIEVAKAAGFKTYWFSNQHRYGLIDNPLTVLAEEADEVHFTAKSGLDTDDKLISLVDKYTKNINPDENNLIIIHLMGSHARYKDRLPKGTDTQWKETGISYMGDYAKDGDLVNDVNAYDKTIQKDDEIMKAIYDNISAKVSDISAFIFIPDHGEDVYGKRHHDSSQFNWEMARVPFVMLFSDKWIDKNSDRFSVLKNNVEKPFTSDLFYDCLAGVMGINSDSVDKNMDISDPKFSLSWDNAMTMKTNNTLQTQFYSKSQVHMLNEDPEYQVKKNIAYLNSLGDDSRFLGVCNDTVGRGLKTLSLGFNGIEINVTPTENGIMMGHGPEVILDITLDEYLSYMPMDKIKKIWLDVKMDDPALIDKAFRDFEKIDKKYHIKDKSIFECYLSDEKMSMFADNGWQLTYYIHFRFNNVGVEFPKAVKDLIQNESGTPRRYNVSSIEEKEEINRFTIALAKSIKRQKSVNVSFLGEMFSYLDEDLYPLLGNGYGFCTWAVPEIPQLTDIDFTDKINKNYPPILNFSGNIKSILVESNVDYRSF